jgi:AraC-like DNA-binding protein
MPREPRVDVSHRTGITIAGEQRVLGVHFTVGVLDYVGARETTTVMPGPLFGCCLDGVHAELVEVSIDGRGPTKVRNSGTDLAVSLSGDRELTVKAKGEAAARNLMAYASPEAFERVFGTARFAREIQSHYGSCDQRPMDFTIIHRVASICVAGTAVPLAMSEGLTAAFLVEWYRAFGGKALSTLVPSIGKLRFKQIVDYIDDSLERDLSIAELAALGGLSISQFAHAFKREFGVSPYRYVIGRRISRSRSLLRSTEATIEDIAAQVGFSSHSRFGQTFLRMTGCTPSSYRANDA